MDCAARKDWDQVRVSPEAYRYSGSAADVVDDPRREESYIDQAMESLGLQKGSAPYVSVTEDDMNAVREVIRRKASVFWIEGSPRTTLLHLMHDTRPTGPPVRTPPHILKAEEADFVDDQLAK